MESTELLNTLTSSLNSGAVSGGELTIDMTNISVMIIMSLAGAGYWMYGKSVDEVRYKIVGGVFMFGPYLASETWQMLCLAFGGLVLVHIRGIQNLYLKICEKFKRDPEDWE